MITRSHNVQVKRLSKNMLIGVAALLSLLWGAAQGASAQTLAEYDIGLGIGIGSGVRANIVLTVYVNQNQQGNCDGKAIFAVHGFAHTAATWRPFAKAIFKKNPAGHEVCQIVAIDLPGHGKSSLPTGLLFGELTLDQYVEFLRETLGRLPDLGLRPQTLLGHSQGGLLIQMTQQALAHPTDPSIPSTNLANEFGVKNVVLMAPVPPQQISWAFADSGIALTLLGQFLAFDPALGTYINIPDEVWPILFFSADRFGNVVPDAPTSDQVAALGYNAPEPLVSALQLVGATPFERPQVDAGLFDRDSGTTLQIVTYAHDTIVLQNESERLFEHLTSDNSLAGLAVVDVDVAVHDMHVSDPRTLLNQIAGTIHLP